MAWLENRPFQQLFLITGSTGSGKSMIATTAALDWNDGWNLCLGYMKFLGKYKATVWPRHIHEDDWRKMTLRKVVERMPTQTSHKDILVQLSRLSPKVFMRSWMTEGSAMLKRLVPECFPWGARPETLWAGPAASLRMSSMRLATGQRPLTLQDRTRPTNKTNELAVASVVVLDEAQVPRDEYQLYLRDMLRRLDDGTTLAQKEGYRYRCCLRAEQQISDAMVSGKRGSKRLSMVLRRSPDV